MRLTFRSFRVSHERIVPSAICAFINQTTRKMGNEKDKIYIVRMLFTNFLRNMSLLECTFYLEAYTSYETCYWCNKHNSSTNKEKKINSWKYKHNCDVKRPHLSKCEFATSKLASIHSSYLPPRAWRNARLVPGFNI